MFLQNWYPRETSLLFTSRQMLCSISVRKCIRFYIPELQWRDNCSLTVLLCGETITHCIVLWIDNHSLYCFVDRQSLTVLFCGETITHCIVLWIDNRSLYCFMDRQSLTVLFCGSLHKAIQWVSNCLSIKQYSEWVIVYPQNNSESDCLSTKQQYTVSNCCCYTLHYISYIK
jgi:hypothetical protein